MAGGISAMANITSEDLAELRTHMYRYLVLYDRHFGIVVDLCNRFKGDRECGAEIRTISARSGGEVMKFLTGCFADVTKEEDKAQIIEGVTNFSMLHNKHKNCDTLMLGPGRFVNHNCVANSEMVFNKENKNVAHFRIKESRTIEKLDEINIFYGLNYYGVNNAECQCEHCQ